MSNTNETITVTGPSKAGDPLAAILAEMRDERIIRLDDADVTRCLLRNLADRIEAAVKSGEVVLRLSKEAYKGMQDALSEHDRLCEMLSESRESIGNAAAMREALLTIDGNTDLLDIAEDLAPNLHPSHSFVAVQIRKIARAALSKPARNCDVGTADEQADRFKTFCYSHRTPSNECSKECQFNDTSAVCYCQARWAQTPYEGKETPNG